MATALRMRDPNFSPLDGPLKIRYKGVFDFDGLYKHVSKWCAKKNFYYSETVYKDKVDSPFGNEIEITVEGDSKVTEFVRYRLLVEYHLWESKNITTKINGKDVERMQGRIEIKLNGFVYLDWQKKFKNHPWLEKFLINVLLRREIESKYFGGMIQNVNSLAKDIKTYLNIEAN